MEWKLKNKWICLFNCFFFPSNICLYTPRSDPAQLLPLNIVWQLENVTLNYSNILIKVNFNSIIRVNFLSISMKERKQKKLFLSFHIGKQLSLTLAKKIKHQQKPLSLSLSILTLITFYLWSMFWSIN